MGFGGAVAGMITSLKNNNRRHKRDAFECIQLGTDKESQGVPVKPITEEALQEIRNKLKNEQRIVFKKQMIVFTLVFLVIVAGILYIVQEPLRILEFLSKLGV